jgi:hypothetical protein
MSGLKPPTYSLPSGAVRLYLGIIHFSRQERQQHLRLDHRHQREAPYGPVTVPQGLHSKCSPLHLAIAVLTPI